MTDIIIFDLDGTIADIEHRKCLVDGTMKTKNWPKFFRECVYDTVIEHTKLMWDLLREHQYELFIFSGRSDEVEVETVEWLQANGFDYDYLIMRPAGDYTPDDELKERWVQPYLPRVKMIFDDRDKVVAMWRRLGIPCFQVAEGTF